MTTTFMVRELYKNKTENYLVADWSEWSATEYRRADLFRLLQREYGGCVSFLYHESEATTPYGWIFEKSARYQDTGDSYTQQTWVELAQPSDLCASCGQLEHDHHHFRGAEYSAA